MKNKIVIYLIFVAAIVNVGCGGAASGKNEGSEEANRVANEKLAACGKADFAEASKSDLINASDDFAKTENFGCAEAMCDEFERRFPEHFARFECRGNVLFKQKQYAQALVYFDRLIAAKPDYSYGLLLRSFIQEELKNLDAALADADAAFKLIEREAEQTDARPFAAKVLIQRGYMRFLKGDDKSAFKDFDRAAELNPNTHLAYAGRAFVRRRLGQNELANADEARANELKHGKNQN